MIRSFRVFALIFSFAFGLHQASALDIGAQVGARMNSSSAPDVTSKDRLGFQGGILAVVPIVPLFGFRTGGLIVQRDAEVEFSGESLKANRVFLDIPLTLQANLGLAKLYAGADAGLKVASSCSFSGGGGGECKLNEEKSVVFQPVVGAEVSILPFVSLGAFYEFETEYSKEWKQSAYGVTGTIMF